MEHVPPVQIPANLQDLALEHFKPALALVYNWELVTVGNDSFRRVLHAQHRVRRALGALH
jgi:hypothetical protein